MQNSAFFRTPCIEAEIQKLQAKNFYVETEPVFMSSKFFISKQNTKKELLTPSETVFF